MLFVNCEIKERSKKIDLISLRMFPLEQRRIGIIYLLTLVYLGHLYMLILRWYRMYLLGSNDNGKRGPSHLAIL